jgi:hypothetical protein
MFTKEELIDQRLVNQQFATVVPKLMKKLEFRCHDDYETAEYFIQIYNTMTGVKEIQFLNIGGTLSHHEQLKAILEPITSKVTTLDLQFESP